MSCPKCGAEGTTAVGCNSCGWLDPMQQPEGWEATPISENVLVPQKTINDIFVLLEKIADLLDKLAERP